MLRIDKTSQFKIFIILGITVDDTLTFSKYLNAP